MKLRKTKQEKLKATLKGILGDGPVQFEITKDGMSVRNADGVQIFALKGKVKVETKLRECEKCNSEGRKKELEALEKDRKDLDKLQKDLSKQNEAQLDKERVLDERTKTLIERENEIKKALKKLCND